MKNIPVNPSEDLQAIREIMERSAKFLSLSGLSGIFAGVCALAGAAIAWFFILEPGHRQYYEYLGGSGDLTSSGKGFYLALDAFLVLGIAALGAIYFSMRKARIACEPFWNHATRRLLVHLMIPMAAGAVFTLILLYRSHPELVASAMLIFYGLSLVNAGKFTFTELHYLGLIEISLGVLAGVFIDYGLILWTIGFGFMHIVYGTVMYYRHER